MCCVFRVGQFNLFFLFLRCIDRCIAEYTIQYKTAEYTIQFSVHASESSFFFINFVVASLFVLMVMNCLPQS